MMLRSGIFLQDRYEILEPIGSGGMSVVYKAKCHKLNRLVAIKVLKEEFCNDNGFVSKFKMEAQAAARLSHPNIVSVYDVIDEGSIHYIVMELIEGITLKSYIRKKGRLEVKESIGIAIQVAQGIAAAHEQHIIHRDIKPQNMIISRDGKVKVADFGIARAVSAQTLTSAAMGSVHYISPEQARGGFSDERSDLYSLGITMYEMVTGRLPFEGDNTVAIALAHLEDAMVPPSVYNPDIPVSLERIILKCAEKKPERRYASANDVIADLRKSLLHPDEDFVKTDTQKHALKGDTIIITNKELSQIKEREGTASRKTGKEAEHGQESEHARSRERIMEKRDKHSKRTSSGEDDVSHGIEKLLAGVGVVVAVVIVAVLIVVVSRLGGAFRFGTVGDSTVAAAENSEEASTLKDTEVYMPDLRNKTEEMAELELKESFISMKRTYAFYDDIEKGRIAEQSPEPGEVVLKGSYVNVVVSNGSDKLDLTTLGLESLNGTTAQKYLENRNLVVQVEEEESETVEAGMVLRYEPELVAEGGIVKLYVSSGPHVERVAVPQLTGHTEEDAVALLAEAGLTPGSTTTESSDTVPKGMIIRQSGGTEDGMIEVGGAVDYVVSSGPEVKHQRYVASINEVYDLSSLIGPGAGSSSVTVMVRLRQGTDADPIYKVLTQETTVKGDVLLPISYTSIESMNGTDQGELEVVDVNTGAVLKTYSLTFFPMD